MMTLHRRLEPEWLDTLDANDARAKRARRELRLVNALMGNASFIAGALQGAMRDGAKIADLGAGDGTLMLRIAQKLRPRPVGVTLALVDRVGTLSAQTIARFAALDWHVTHQAADAAAWLRAAPERYDAITANLFLHHLDATALRELLALLAERSALFVACEPRRSALALTASRALGAIGCGPVTRHDAALSVKAGFDARELSELWPAVPGWQLQERRRGPFAHLFAARREACLTSS
jgi:2-polyprenyl-3-methyl-5-hydroxy-6-metoxy-1,4-benzoquinol methylase